MDFIGDLKKGNPQFLGAFDDFYKKLIAMKAKVGGAGRGQLPLKDPELINLALSSLQTLVDTEVLAVPDLLLSLLKPVDAGSIAAPSEERTFTALKNFATPAFFGFCADKLFAGSELAHLASLRICVSGVRFLLMIRLLGPGDVRAFKLGFNL